MYYSALKIALDNLLREETKDIVVKALHKMYDISSDYPCLSIEDVERAAEYLKMKQPQ